MKTALEVVEQITKEAKEKNIHEVRFVERAKVDDWCRQGDIEIIFVSKDHPKGNARPDHQLAPGFSKGSRHVAQAAIKVFEGVSATQAWKDKMSKTYPRLNISILEKELLGPRLFFPKRALIEHPEHAHVSIPAGSDCQVMYQLNPRTMKRAKD